MKNEELKFIMTYPDGRVVTYVRDEEPMYLWSQEKWDERFNYWFGTSSSCIEAGKQLLKQAKGDKNEDPKRVL